MAVAKDREYRGFRTAAGRLKEELAPSVVAISHNTNNILPTLYAIHMFDKAHLAMLGETGIIPPADAAAMLQELRAVEREGVEKVRLEAGGGMHSAEYVLIRRLGESVGGRIHIGRSSGDLTSVSLSIGQRDRTLDVMDRVNRLRGLVLDLATRYAETVMPGYTHGQQAQPTTLGHWYAMWAAVLARSFERLAQAYRRINVSSAGAAVLTGSDFPLDRRRTAELLGFDATAENTWDATLSHDTVLDSFCALAILNGDLGRWAEDLMLWATYEFDMVVFPDRFCVTSSINAQKKNPSAPQYVRGVAAESAADLVLAFMVQKAPTGTPILERQYRYEALWKLFDDTARDLDWWCEIMPELTWNTDRMLEQAGAHWAQSTDLAGAIVRERGLAWRTAHQITAVLVRQADEEHFGPGETTSARLDKAAVEYFGKPLNLPESVVRDSLNARHFVDARTLIGGPSPKEVRRQIETFRTELQRDEELAASSRERIASAKRKLESAIDALIAKYPPAPRASAS